MKSFKLALTIRELEILAASITDSIQYQEDNSEDRDELDYDSISSTIRVQDSIRTRILEIVNKNK